MRGAGRTTATFERGRVETAGSAASALGTGRPFNDFAAHEEPDAAARRAAQASTAAAKQSVTTARHAVARFSAHLAVDHDGIAIAVSEAVANAVVHAYPDRPDGHVRVHASREPGALLIIVSDDGQGIAARSDRGGLGVGLSLIARLCSSLQIDGDGGGTRVTTRFARDASGVAGSPSA